MPRAGLAFPYVIVKPAAVLDQVTRLELIALEPPMVLAHALLRHRTSGLPLRLRRIMWLSVATEDLVARDSRYDQLRLLLLRVVLGLPRIRSCELARGRAVVSSAVSC